MSPLKGRRGWNSSGWTIRFLVLGVLVFGTKHRAESREQRGPMKGRRECNSVIGLYRLLVLGVLVLGQNESLATQKSVPLEGAQGVEFVGRFLVTSVFGHWRVGLWSLTHTLTPVYTQVAKCETRQKITDAV